MVWGPRKQAQQTAVLFMHLCRTDPQQTQKTIRSGFVAQTDTPKRIGVFLSVPEQALLFGLLSCALRSGAYRVLTRNRAFLVKSSVTILRTGLHVAVHGDFAHNNLRSGTAFRPDCYLYTIRSASPR